MRDVGFAAAVQAPQGPPPAEFGPGPHHYVVEFVGPVKPEWLTEIEAHGGRALEPLPPASYIVALDGPAYDWITTVPSYVHSVLHYGAEMRVDAGLTETLNSDPLLTRGLHPGRTCSGSRVTRRGTRVHDLQRALLRGRSIWSRRSRRYAIWAAHPGK